VRGRFGLPSGSCFLDKREEIEGGIRLTFEYMVDLRLVVDRVLDGECLHERYVWSNVGKKPLEINAGEVGVYVTFADRGERSDVFLARRAYTHILTGSHLYMASSRADGTPQGVALTSVEGNVAEVREEYPSRKDRGELIAYLPAFSLQPEETRTLEWVVYDYADTADYRAKTARYAPVWEGVAGCTERVEKDGGQFVLGDPRSLWERVQVAKAGRNGDTTLYDAYLLAKIYDAGGDPDGKAKIAALLSKYYRKSPHGLDMMPYRAIEIAEMQDKLRAQIEAAKEPKCGPFNVLAEWGRDCLLCEAVALGLEDLAPAIAHSVNILKPFMTTPWGDKLAGWEDPSVVIGLLK
ncbi:MAG: hypothetical protein J5755_04260, partial [Clostridia bacterium]|nr:hypothetical protein [Clostridia bacterium]